MGVLFWASLLSQSQMNPYIPNMAWTNAVLRKAPVSQLCLCASNCKSEDASSIHIRNTGDLKFYLGLFTIHRGFLPLIQLSGEKRAVSFDLFFYVTRRHLKRIKEATYCLANNISLLLIVFKTLLTLQYIHFRLMQRTDTPLLVKVYLQQSESFLWAFWDFNVQNWFSQLDRLVPDIL